MNEDFIIVEVWLYWPADSIRACGIWPVPRSLNQSQTEKLVDAIITAMDTWFLHYVDKFPGHAKPGHKYVPVTLGKLLSIAAQRECAKHPEDDYRRFVDRDLVIYLGKDHVKQPATLSIRLGPEGVLVTLTDRDLAVSFDVACSSLTEAFAAMETALTSLSPPMRSWGKKEPSLRKRRQSG